MKCVFFALFILQVGFSQHLESLDMTWKKLGDGVYDFYPEKDSGGIYIPIKKYKSDLKENFEVIYIPRDYSKMISLIESPVFGPIGQCSYEDFQSFPTTPKINNFCDNLKDEPENIKEEFLYQCFVELRKKINKESSMDYEKTIRELFKLNPYEQEFMSAVLTGYGEGRSESEEEIAMIFKTLENRKKYAIAKDCKNANILDMALQPYQFSMWRKDDPNWPKAISLENEEFSEKKDFKRMIKIFINYREGKYKFEPLKTANRVYHYRMKNMDKEPDTPPDWGPSKIALLNLKVNKKNIGKDYSTSEHYFFKKVAWSFKFHPLRQKKKGEDKCYPKS